ncbi:hypothetical protein PV328_006042 [Microctonus aethiopoides]|uniref:Uncharacterized protein n=1 Tax=Microctonus aethiopoides TaxID=144406 RepID=A0AA39KT43_9HYME|nr:hypothetical protein PV328_006042 [Microctonus aethiopoides]
MFETGRRSAISSSELGLYSDRADRYNRSKYGLVIRKFVIGIMAIVAVILAAIFIYDFASGATAGSKVSQETKHIYMLQNTLKKPIKLSTTPIPKPEVDKLTSSGIQDRSDDNNGDDDDDDDDEKYPLIDTNDTRDVVENRAIDFNHLPQMKSQSLENFKLRKRLLNVDGSEEPAGEVESKQLFSNHAVVYRVRQMYEHPDVDDEIIEQESRPTPFHFELKTPHPSSFKRLKFPQLTQYRYPHTSRNIQDVIKYLTNNPETSKHGIKFTGVYVNPNKYDTYPDAEQLTANSDRSEMPSATDEIEEGTDEETSQFSIINHDPFFQYKPKHPAEVNLLAPTNLRFSPAVMHRYNNYFEPSTVYHRPMLINRPPIPIEQNYDNAGAYTGNFAKKRKAKPFSVMLDIYPITDLHDQPPNKKNSRPRLIPNLEEYQDPRKPLTQGRGGRYFPTSHVAPGQPIPVIALPATQHGMSEEDEKKQMVFHLNLYPRKKSKFSRNDILQRSETMRPEERQQFMDKVISPLATITKQLTDHSFIEESKIDEYGTPTNLPLTKYQESFLEMPNEKDPMDDEGMKSLKDEIPMNHKKIGEEIAKNTLKYSEKMINEEINIPTTTINVDTVEGFQKFADGLVTSN